MDGMGQGGDGGGQAGRPPPARGAVRVRTKTLHVLVGGGRAGARASEAGNQRMRGPRNDGPAAEGANTGRRQALIRARIDTSG